MTMNLAVYTAQEGYSWQPGTAFTAEELARFKKAIGKFPSPDSMDFPFGGIFLLEDRVVLYRYHVAKKIDFRGRDALYCVLGAIPRAEAAKIDPAALFSCPEFAGPMKPFPVSLDVPESDPAAVPEWMKNLDKMTLDVRISGPAENPHYAVVQNPVAVPPSPTVVPPKDDSAKITPADDTVKVAPADHIGRVARPARPSASRWMVWWAASLAVVALLLAVVAILLWIKVRTINGPTGTNLVPVATNVVTVATNVPPSTNAATAPKSKEVKQQ